MPIHPSVTADLAAGPTTAAGRPACHDGRFAHPPARALIVHAVDGTTHLHSADGVLRGEFEHETASLSV
ncbi:MAG: hypothetical protein J2P17_22700 [Mycobacterium sp.]|nr:hypothetical protein [Mycobacterium sp.]